MSYGSLLLPPSGFLAGLASVFGFGGSSGGFDPALSADQVDRLALESDWRAVGQDMWLAFHEIGRQLPEASVGQANQAARTDPR